MVRGVRARLLIAVGMLAATAVAPAEAQALSLVADHPETGWIRLRVNGTDGATVDLAEQTAAGQKPVAEVKLAGGRAVIRHGEIWRCDEYVRHFVAMSTAPDGTTETTTADVRTPSCARRLRLSAKTIKKGRSRRIAIRLTDRWGVGDVPARICVAAPGRRLACRSVRIPGGRKQALVSYRAAGAGLWSVLLQTTWKQGATVRTFVRPARKLRLLATGDSMIEYLDTSLAKRLGPRGIKVRGDPRISTGLSKPFLLNWPRLAKKQARSLRPDITVVFIGANDGFPFGSIDCCGDAWVDAYATRAQSMMASYSRQGRGLVYWLTLPAAQPAQWKSVYPAVNRALHRAAAGFAGQIRLIEDDRVFSPGFQFRQSITWQGRRQVVRQGDGVHLSVAGAGIAEQLVQRAMRQDGVL